MLGLDAQNDQGLVAVAVDEVDGLACGHRQSLEQRHRLVEPQRALRRTAEQKRRAPNRLIGLGVLHDVSGGNQRAQDPWAMLACSSNVRASSMTPTSLPASRNTASTDSARAIVCVPAT